MHYTSARVSKRGNRYRAFLSFKDEAGTSRQVSKTLDARGISQAKRELAAWRAEMEARAEAEDRKGGLRQEGRLHGGARLRRPLRRRGGVG